MNGRDWVNPPSESAADDWTGRVLAERYRVDARIGRGGMGIVYRGTHLELGKRVAIKRLDVRLSHDSTTFDRFRREAIAACRIDSPYVVQVFDWGKATDESPFIVMELLEGRSLREHFEREGRLSVTEAVAIAVQILKGLQRIHHANVLHRDLKPENVFLCDYAEAVPFVKLLDFGISKQLSVPVGSPQVTDTGVVLGTAAYMSPEQAKSDKELDVRSDLYSLGVVLFEALTGTVPHRGNTYAGILVDICTRDADDVRLHSPLVPEALAKTLAKALRRERDERYGSALEFIDALLDAIPALRQNYDSGRNSQSSLVTQASASNRANALASTDLALTPTTTSPTLSRRYPLSLAVGGAVGIVLITGLTLWHLRSPRPSAVPTPNAGVTLAPTPQKPAPQAPAPQAPAPQAPIVAQVNTAAPTPPASTPAPTATLVRKTTRSPKTNAPSEPTSGVAGALKLRRSMP